MHDGRNIPLAMRGKGLQMAHPGTSQDVAFSETATSSAAVGSTTYAVRLMATKACRVIFAQTPTAVSTSMRLAAEMPEYFFITGSYKVGVIRDTESGTLNITEIN